MQQVKGTYETSKTKGLCLLKHKRQADRLTKQCIDFLLKIFLAEKITFPHSVTD